MKLENQNFAGIILINLSKTKNNDAKISLWKFDE